MTGTMKSDRRTVLLWGAGALLAGVLSMGSVVAVFGGAAWREALAGWGLAVLNAVAASVMNRFAVRPAGQGFPLKGLVFSTVRFLALLGLIVVAFGLLGRQGFRPFLLAMLTGYFVFLAAEIVRLHRSVAGGSADHE